MQNYLTADNLTVGYRGKPILSDISMNIRRGSIVTLIGPNGAGKSTILKSIIRELSPLGGSVFLDGTALEDYSDPDFAKKTAVVMTGRPDPELMTCFDVAAAGTCPKKIRKRSWMPSKWSGAKALRMSCSRTPATGRNSGSS